MHQPSPLNQSRFPQSSQAARTITFVQTPKSRWQYLLIWLWGILFCTLSGGAMGQSTLAPIQGSPSVQALPSSSAHTGGEAQQPGPLSICQPGSDSADTSGSGPVSRSQKSNEAGASGTENFSLAWWEAWLIDEDDQMARHHYNQGMQAFEKGNHDEARKHLMDALSGSGHQEWAWRIHYNLGISLMCLHQFSEAVGEFQQARLLQPEHGPSQQNLILAYLMRQQQEQSDESSQTGQSDQGQNQESAESEESSEGNQGESGEQGQQEQQDQQEQPSDQTSGQESQQQTAQNSQNEDSGSSQQGGQQEQLEGQQNANSESSSPSSDSSQQNAGRSEEESLDPEQVAQMTESEADEGENEEPRDPDQPLAIQSDASNSDKEPSTPPEDSPVVAPISPEEAQARQMRLEQRQAEQLLESVQENRRNFIIRKLIREGWDHQENPEKNW